MHVLSCTVQHGRTIYKSAAIATSFLKKKKKKWKKDNIYKIYGRHRSQFENVTQH